MESIEIAFGIVAIIVLGIAAILVSGGWQVAKYAMRVLRTPLSRRHMQAR